MSCDDPKMMEDFQNKAHANLSIDGAGDLAYIAPTRVNLQPDHGTLAQCPVPRHPRAVTAGERPLFPLPWGASGEGIEE